MTKKDNLDLILEAATNNPIYSMFASVSEMFPTLRFRSKSHRSLELDVEKGKLPEAIIDAYLSDKSNKEAFKAKFAEAISGDGNEIEKIGALHSSSLLSLLHFYDPKRISLMVNLGAEKDCFTSFYAREAKFEVKRQVFGAYSNMDVVLYGTTRESKEEVELNLESKFTEYLKSKTSEIISKAYEPYVRKWLPYLQIEDCGDGKIKLISDKPRYLYGLKQIISHFLALDSDKGSHHYFGEIVMPVYCQAYYQYLADYEDLATRIMQDSKNVTVLPQLLEYGKHCMAIDIKSRIMYGERSLTQDPYVGPFFYIDKEVYSHSEPLTFQEGERLIDSKTSHMDLYSTLAHRRVGAALLHPSYSHYPRGRVIFDIKTGKALVYLDKSLEKDEQAKQQIKEEFHLRHCDIEYRQDEHYQHDEAEHPLDYALDLLPLPNYSVFYNPAELKSSYKDLKQKALDLLKDLDDGSKIRVKEELSYIENNNLTDLFSILSLADELSRACGSKIKATGFYENYLFLKLLGLTEPKDIGDELLPISGQLSGIEVLNGDFRYLSKLIAESLYEQASLLLESDSPKSVTLTFIPKWLQQDDEELTVGPENYFHFTIETN